MEFEDLIERVEYSEWAAPTVAVPQKDGRFHMWVTINKNLAVDQYPLPGVE